MSLWPDIPYQTCQFHYLQEAARPIFAIDRGVRAQMRKAVTNKLRPLPSQIEERLSSITSDQSDHCQQERQQLDILSEYVSAAQASCHLDGKLPFDYPGVKGYQSLDALDQSLEHLKKEQKKPENL